MSFNKSKTRQSAERYLAQGKIKAAINEYVFIVDNDPTDYNTLNVLGDLYARVHEKDEAVECFKRLAEHYNKQGFSQKAIAVYNKITRLKPDSVEVSAKLAPLYQMKGLVSEARSHYSVLAEYYKNTGKKLEALKIWQQIAELDPNNVDVFFTLAENYLQEDYTEEAAEAFTEAGRRFANQKNYEKAINAYSKALSIHPLEITAIEGLISCQITSGYYDEAISLIERTLEEHPNNIDLMSLLLSCHVELNNFVEAENTVVTLVEREPANYRKFLDVVGLYLKSKDTNSATRILALCSEHLLVAGQAEELKTWIDEILAQNPEQVDALSILVRLHAWQREDEELKGALIQMSEAARANGDVENEKIALSQLVLMAPQEIRFRERLLELGGNDGEVLRDYQTGSYIQADQAIPTFESFGNLADNKEEEYSDHIKFLTNEEIDSLTSDTYETPNGFAMVETNGHYASSNGNGHVELNGSYPTIAISDVDVVAESPAEQPVASQLDKSREAHLMQELESVDFYLNEGYSDLAIQTLDLLEAQFGKHPAIESRRKQLNLDPVPSVDVPLEVVQTEAPVYEQYSEVPAEENISYKTVIEQETVTEATLTEPTSIAPEFIEPEPVEPAFVEPVVNESELVADSAVKADPFGAPEDFDAAVVDAALEKIAASVEPEAASEIVETVSAEDVDIPVQEDLRALLEEELGDAPADVTETASELSIFEEFRSGLGLEEIAPVPDSDFETHYNLGTAYKEMGLFEDAVEAFQEAVKLVTAEEEGRRFLTCCHSLGYCFMEKSMPKLAQLWYEKALQTRGLTMEEKQALNYEIALAFEKQNKPKQALELYSEIYATDVTYRDVKNKLESLQNSL